MAKNKKVNGKIQRDGLLWKEALSTLEEIDGLFRVKEFAITQKGNGKFKITIHLA